MCQSNNKEILHNEVYINIQTGEVLDWNRVEGLKDNALLKVRPDLWEIWNFEKNEELGFDIWKITKGTERVVWWYCKDFNDTYPQKVDGKIRSYECSICCGKYITEANSLATLNPKLASEWHPTLNDTLTPSKVPLKSNKIVWWKCSEYENHIWENSISNRNKGDDCPFCSSRQLLVGFNDMWTTNPELASSLANHEDGYKYMQHSGQYVDWKCQSCNEIIKNKRISHTYNIGICCPNCSDGFSFPEKVMYHLLLSTKVDFEWQKRFEWSDLKLYDYYLEYNGQKIIIETHGEQHYIQTKRKGARSLEEEQTNDKYKYKMAIANGIDKYIVIDCRYSDFEFIKDNILNSDLNNIIDLKDIDWNNTNINSQKSIHLEILNLWNEGYSKMEISTIVKLHKATVYKVLKKFDKLGLCEYNGRRKSSDSLKSERIYQFTKDFELVKVWESVGVIEKELGINKNSIYKCCSKHQKTSNNFIWKYEKDVVGWSVPIHNNK